MEYLLHSFNNPGVEINNLNDKTIRNLLEHFMANTQLLTYDELLNFKCNSKEKKSPFIDREQLNVDIITTPLLKKMHRKELRSFYPIMSTLRQWITHYNEKINKSLYLHDILREMKDNEFVVIMVLMDNTKRMYGYIKKNDLLLEINTLDPTTLKFDFWNCSVFKNGKNVLNNRLWLFNIDHADLDKIQYKLFTVEPNLNVSTTTTIPLNANNIQIIGSQFKDDTSTNSSVVTLLHKKSSDDNTIIKKKKKKTSDDIDLLENQFK
jgi:hypothetical protein